MARAPWLLVSAILAAGAWAVTQQLRLGVGWRGLAAAVAVAVPLVVSELRERFKQDDEYTSTLRQSLRLYSRRGVPTVASVRDLTLLRVSPSREPKRGPYVPRDRDTELDRYLNERVFVLLIGDSKAGKSRMAAEAIRRNFPSRQLIFPEDADALSRLLDVRIDLRDSVIWLDDLQRYLTGGSLTRLLGLLEGDDAPAGASIVATIRNQAFDEHLPHAGLESPYWPVLQRAQRLRIDRMFSMDERQRTALAYTDPRTIAALDRWGLAEYLAAGPDLVERLESGMISEQVGALVVMVAADWHRAGFDRPIPRSLLIGLVPRYAQEHGVEPPDAADIQKALDWAQRPMYAASSLLLGQGDSLDVFDYVLDHIGQRWGTELPQSLWEAAIGAARDGEEALRIGLAANEQHRTEIAVLALQVAVRDGAQVSAPIAGYNYAAVLEGLGRTEEAEDSYRRAAELGHLESAYAAGRLLAARGDDEAERYYRLAAQGDHPLALLALGRLLRVPDPQEALRLLARAAELGEAEAAYTAGQLLEESDRAGEARDYYRIAAHGGYAEGMYALGVLLREDDQQEALRWFRSAAELGHAQAAYSAWRIHDARGERDEARRFAQMAQADRDRSGQEVVPAETSSAGRALVSQRRRGALEWTAIVGPIGVLDGAMHARTDEELRHFNDSLRRRVARGESLDAILPEAFAAVREAIRRIIGVPCADPVLVAAAALHSGRIVQLRPGDDYWLAMVLAAHLRALAGRGAHVLVHDERALNGHFAAARAVHALLGMRTGLTTVATPESERRAAYLAELTYGTPTQFVFDYLADGRALEPKDRMCADRYFAVADEADIVLLDDARQNFDVTSLAEAEPRWFVEFARIARLLQPGVHYLVDRQRESTEPTLAGIAWVEDTVGVDNLYLPENAYLVRHLGVALDAKELYLAGRDYLVRDGQVRLLDRSTGAVKQSTVTYNGDVQQAIQAKERIEITGLKIPEAQIRQRAFLRQYPTLAGLAEGATADAEAYQRLYGLDAVAVPADRPVRLLLGRDVLYRDDEVRTRAVAEVVVERHRRGQPVLVDVASDQQAGELAALLEGGGIAVRTVSTHDRAAAERILEDAAAPGSVVVAVNAWHTHVDAPLGGTDGSPQQRDAVVAAGGLLVIGCGRSKSQRRDTRLANHAGRRGEPGEAVFYLARTDALLEGVPTLGASLVGDQPLSGAMLSRGIAARQRLLTAVDVEALAVGVRWDGVVEEYRLSLTTLRDRVLDGLRLTELTDDFARETVRAYVEQWTPAAVRAPDDLDELNGRLAALCGNTVERLALTAGEQRLAIGAGTPANRGAGLQRRRGATVERRTVESQALELVRGALHRRREQFGEEAWFELQRRIVLGVIDSEWRDFLAGMDEAWDETNLDRLKGRDPEIAYVRAGAELYRTLLTGVRENSVRLLITIQVQITDQLAAP